VFPFHIVQLSINICGDLRMPPELVRQELEGPTYVHVAVERSDSTILAVDEWRAFMPIAGDVVEGRAHEGRLNDFLDMVLRLPVIVDVEMPRIYVSIRVGEVF